MSNRKAAAVIAGIVIIAGLAIGFWPHKVADPSTAGSSNSCGAALAPDDTASQAAQLANDMAASKGYNGELLDDPAQACSDALKTPRVAAIIVLGVGAAGLLWIALTTDWKTAASRAAGNFDERRDEPADT